MFDYKQRETTDAYRDGWDRIWNKGGVMWYNAETKKPKDYEKVLIYGIIEYGTVQTQEGYWDGEDWRSVQTWLLGIDRIHPKIQAYQWTYMPVPEGI